MSGGRCAPESIADGKWPSTDAAEAGPPADACAPGDFDTADGAQPDGDASGGDVSGPPARCVCDYRGLSSGVCTGQRRLPDGGCGEPSAYESDETACDDLDNDCDGTVDEGCACDYRDRSAGVCAGETREADGTCSEPSAYEPAEASCDDLDNDCDGVVDENCPCSYQGTAVGVCGEATIDDRTGECAEPAAYQPMETHCDGEDNDCDGTIDADEENLTCECIAGEMRDCYTGPAETKGVGACSAGTQTCLIDGTWGVCEGETTPRETESCDGVDGNCNGVVDEACPCNFNDVEAGVCADQIRDSEGLCPEPTDHESPEDSCGDGLDNDCDETTDCGDADCDGRVCAGSGTACAVDQGACQEVACEDGLDNDEDGDTDCADASCEGRTCGGAGTECRAGDVECHEADCGDGVDNDSDGNIDCRDADCDGRICAGPGSACDSNDGQCRESDCGDGVDNDEDGSTDCADSDCARDSCTRPNGASGVCCPSKDDCVPNLNQC